MGSKANQRSAGIDLLRTIAVLIVIFSHYGLLVKLPFGGTHGVVLFFMVSGYCMSYSTKGRNGFQFIDARLWRLVPTLIICATLTALVEFFFYDVRPDRGQSIKSYAANLVCLPAGNLICDLYFSIFTGKSVQYSWVDGAYWSLLVEIRFYLLLWFMRYVLNARYNIFMISCLGLFAIGGSEWGFVSKSNDFFMYLPFFAFGMASNEFFRGNRYGFLLMAYSFFIFLSLSYIGVQSISMGLNQGNLLSYAFCFAFFFLCLRSLRTSSNKYLSYFGILTYPLYLLHQDIGYILIELGSFASSWITIPATFAIVFALSVFVNKLIERYQTIVRKRLSRFTKRFHGTFGQNRH